ncbi:Hypothetical protein SCF082_LOCUS26828 [Durusdinium trenchii]|uniref:Mitochondrial import receptor subunit TOM22 homolog n=1 Tax=Durusdinium trenchii TaxID=1381693 RepID=A0ABP0MD59_9DINO
MADPCEAQNTEAEETCQEDAADPKPDAFMFPCALKSSDLAEDSSSEEDEDTDAPDGVLSSIYNTKMFSDPEEYEKWKARGWRAVQCCGGALLVLALIFDEMD